MPTAPSLPAPRQPRQPHLLRRLLWSLAGLLLVLLLGATAALLVYRGQVLPQTDGRLVLPAGAGSACGPVGERCGPLAELQIERDTNGIPTIRANSPQDAMFGLGYAHAQDRLWQLDNHRRIASGRLAEAFGPPALETDKFLRALGVARAAEAQWQALGDEGRQALLAYTAGINSFLRQGLRARPPEFIALGLQPQDWTPQDSLGWAIMMAWDLGGNWTTELLRMRLALQMPVERINQLLPPYPDEQPLATADYSALFRELTVDGRLGQQALLAAPVSGIDGLGSNNWVLAGSRSRTGQPLLANDPHLRLSAPALWYFARLEAPGLQVAGATLPGLPVVVLGQNRDIAWGFTNTGPDVQDLYLERIKPDDPGQYQTPTGWAPFQVFQETIRVKGRPDVQLRVRSTRHGPVISDGGSQADGLLGPRASPRYALALRWTALDPDPGAIEAGIAFNRARSVAEFVTASDRYVAPMQNMVVADRAGHIGMVTAGRVPLRGPQNDLKGLVPAPGWEARYDWVGFVPARETPRVLDPASGAIASANQRIHSPDYPHYLTSEWTLPYRQQRIEQLLAEQPQHDLASLRRIQADDLSLATRSLLPLLQQARSDHALAPAVQALLAGFDGRMAADQPAPLIFWAWVRELNRRVFADEVGAAFYERHLAGRGMRDALERVLASPDGLGWCDDQGTPEAEGCARLVDEALGAALDELQASQGPDPAAWRWGKAHQARSEHRPFSKVAWLAPLFELRRPVGGDTYTVNASRVNLRADPLTGERYLSEHGPSLRALYDLGTPANSRFMLSSGQSGLVLSPHYRDFATPWARVEDVPVWPDGPPQHTLVLSPQR